MATVSCIMVLVLGNLLGATVKGITGFGSAIFNLCVWVVCTCAGIDSGTLQQAVVSECICSEAGALPLLYVTKARATCDWRLVASLGIFGAVGAPIGAALLTNLQPRYVEFVMACVLLVVICLHCRVVHHIRQWLSSTWSQLQGETQCPTGKPADCEVCLTEQVSPCQQPDSTKQQLACSMVCVLGQVEAAHTLGAAGAPARIDALSTARGTDAALVLPCCHPVTSSPSVCCQGSANRENGIVADAGCGSCSSRRSSICDVECKIEVVTAGEQAAVASDGAEDEQASLLPSKLDRCSGGAHTAEQLGAGQAVRRTMQGSSGGGGGGIFSSRWQGVKDWWAVANQPEELRATAKTCLIGAAAGIASGIMQGMTGMGGPPLMMMYEKLEVPKDTVRGSNAVLNVLQFRVIAYALMGAFHKEDVWLYTAVSVVGLFGLWCGNRLAGGMHQATFSRVMVALMILCCVLMFASAAGMAGN